jgi:surfeit locus 1 family protein
MKTKADPRLARMAKNAIATMNFIRVIISIPRTRAFAWVTLAMLLGVAVTVRLGYWQLARAAEKESRHAAIVAQMAAPALNTSALLAQPTYFDHVHQRVVLQGVWLPEHTVYLDNRPMNGHAGFWVLTPLQLDASTRVVVQRGWVPRHQLDRTLLPEIQTPTGVVQVQGRLAPPPSALMMLGSAQDAAASASEATPIRQNLNMAAYAVQVGGAIAATVLQTDAASDGVLRDWPEIAAGVEKNMAYAFQWFALAALQWMLYIWFQFIQPYRHARRSSF